MLMPYPTLGGPEAMELDSQTVMLSVKVSKPTWQVGNALPGGPM